MADYTLPTTEARARFLSLVKDAGGSYSRYVITYRGKPEAVMLGFDEYEGWIETLDIAQSPTWKRALAEARREEKSGRRLPFEEVVGRPLKPPRGARSGAT